MADASLRQTGTSDNVLPPVLQILRPERLARPLVREERHVTRLRLPDRPGEIGVQRDLEASLRLLLSDRNHVVPDVLRPHPGHVTRPLRRVEVQRKAQALPGPEGVERLEVGDLLLRSTMETVALRRLHALHVPARVGVDHVDPERMAHQDAEDAQEVVRSRRCGRLRVDDRLLVRRSIRATRLSPCSSLNRSMIPRYVTFVWSASAAQSPEE